MAQSETRVSYWQDWFGWITERFSRTFVGLGNIESRVFADRLDELRIERPIYISGLARSGSTLLLELLASHPDVTTHRYRDFPFVHTPIWWNWFLDRAGSRRHVAVERAHKDRILVTPDSPEAMEEVLWMTFFRGCHDPAQNNVLDRKLTHAAFEQFYRDHIRKILHIRGAARYLSKENYNVARLQYLHSLFPDAKFLIPVRDPVSHIASLVKQHRLFCDQERQDPKVLRYMNRIGHFEFGLGRAPINMGDTRVVEEVQRLWADGEEVAGWARYWSMIYMTLAETLASDEDLRSATKVVHYDDLCEESQKTLAAVYAHCELDVDEDLVHRQAATISYPSYYRHGFTDAELDVIATETTHAHETIRRLT